MLAWIYLGLAAFFEIVFAMAMKYSEGFTRLVPSLVILIGAIGGVGFLTMAMKTLPVSVAYPMWTGIGSVGTVILGFVMLGESLSVLKILSVIAIVAGITGLQATTH